MKYTFCAALCRQWEDCVFGLMADFCHVEQGKKKKKFSLCITKTFLTLTLIICTISVSNHIIQNTSLIFYSKMMMLCVVHKFLHTFL